MTSKVLTTVISIDVAKEKIDIYNPVTGKVYTVKNNTRAIGNWLKSAMKNFSISKAVLEPTGGYEDVLIEKLHNLNIDSYFVHPNKLVAYKKAKGIKAKTDDIDAKCIYEFSQLHSEALKPINKAHFESKEIKSLMRTRRQIKMEIHRYKCYAEHGFNDKITKGHNKRMLKLLENDLKKVDNAIFEIMENDEEMKTNVELLKSIDGVGDVTAYTFVAAIPNLGEIKSAQLSSLVGVAPFNKDSGKHSGRRCIYGGRADLRSVLYMAALVATRYNQKMKEVYQRLVAKGKAKKVAIVAVMRRLLIIMNAVVRDQKMYEPQTV